MLRQSWATAVLVAVALPGVACTQDAGGSVKASNVEVTRVETIPVELTVKLRGDINLTMTKRILKSTFIVRQTKDKEQANNQVMGVENIDPVEVDGMLIKAGVSVVPFQGDGKYKFNPGSPSDAVKEEEEAQKTGKPRKRSSMKVEWWSTKDITGPTELFWRRVEECNATVEQDATRGRVVCPVVTNENRSKKFSFELSWDVP